MRISDLRIGEKFKFHPSVPTGYTASQIANHLRDVVFTLESIDNNDGNTYAHSSAMDLSKYGWHSTLDVQVIPIKRKRHRKHT